MLVRKDYRALPPEKCPAVITPEGKAIAHASYLTLDRLTIREPVAIKVK